MSVTIHLDLPDSLVAKARQFGLLENHRVAEWLEEEVRRRAAGQKLTKVLDRIRSVPGGSMAEEEVAAEIAGARAKQREMGS